MDFLKALIKSPTVKNAAIALAGAVAAFTAQYFGLVKLAATGE